MGSEHFIQVLSTATLFQNLQDVHFNQSLSIACSLHFMLKLCICLTVSEVTNYVPHSSASMQYAICNMHRPVMHIVVRTKSEGEQIRPYDL